jgi:tRNA(fMet)-specific endonuclease VapC
VYLLDTTVWIDLLRTNSPAIRHKTHRSWQKHHRPLHYHFVRTAVRDRAHAARQPHLRARHEHLLSEMIAPFDVFPLDHLVFDTYGKVRPALAKSPIGALDTFIAAQALALGATLATSNGKEFHRVPGLVVEDWR